MSYLDWHVGMKVICVDADWPQVGGYLRDHGCALPQEGQIYTIRQIGKRSDDGLIYVRLVELLNPQIKVEGYRYGEPVFGARRFRPVQTRKTDISIFTAMLKPSKVDA